MSDLGNKMPQDVESDLFTCMGKFPQNDFECFKACCGKYPVFSKICDGIEPLPTTSSGSPSSTTSTRSPTSTSSSGATSATTSSSMKLSKNY